MRLFHGSVRCRWASRVKLLTEECPASSHHNPKHAGSAWKELESSFGWIPKRTSENQVCPTAVSLFTLEL